VVIDVPSGRVTARVHREDARAVAVDFINVPSWVIARDVPVTTSLGEVRVSVAYGGAIYATLPAAQVGLTVTPERLGDLIALGREIKWDLNDAEQAVHPTDPRLNGIYGTIWFDDLGDAPGQVHQRNVTVFADARSTGPRAARAPARDPGVRIDWPGTILVVAGLVAVVYGLSEADTKGWGAPTTLVLLVAGVILLAVFVLVEVRVPDPLLPLRIVLDRFRGGAYLAIGLSAIGVFGIFLFLTYYLQLTLAYSPVKTGLAFLPMIAAVMASSTTSSGALMPRLGPRPLIPAGMLVAAGGLVLLATELGLRTSYPGQILPPCC
jgi:hypothetical protein